MLTQAGRLLGIFKSCAPVPAGEPWGVKGTLVAWAVLLGLGGWQLEEALPLQTALPRAAHCSGTHSTLPPASHQVGPRQPGKSLSYYRNFLNMATHESSGPAKGSTGVTNLVQGCRGQRVGLV